MERNGFRIAGYDLDAAKGQAFVAGPAAGRHVETGGVARPADGDARAPAPRPDDGARRRRRRQRHRASQAAPASRRHPDRRRQLAGSSTPSAAARSSPPAGFHYVGTGVSGGEEGALRGPAIMPGGQREAWEALAPILRAIAAKADDGEPCVEYMGPRGAGHYVKMVHNGIEYGDMQLIAEAYDLLARGLRPPGDGAAARSSRSGTPATCSRTSSRSRPTSSRRTDPETGRPLVDLILDEAQQKGTGKWTSQNAFDIGAPIPTINAAVESRILSALKAERVHASRVLHGPPPHYHGRRERLIEAVRGGALREQGHVVRAGVRPAAHGVGGVRIRPAGRDDREDLARRLHHPRLAARRHHGRLPARRRASRTCCSTTRSGRPSNAARALAVRGAGRRRNWGSRCPR